MEFNPQIDLQNFSLADHNSQAAKKKVAATEDFEAVFIQLALKEMRPKIKDGLFNAGTAEEIFYQFMDEAIAKDIAGSENNFGIADAMQQQLFD